jgi:hypothetical protein
MPVQYTTVETIAEIEKAVKDNMATFYRQDFLNRSGNASDTKEPYSEVIAKYLLDHLDLWGKIKPITRESPYKPPDHVGIKVGDVKIEQEEKWLAKSMYGKRFDVLGEIIDYETPLKNHKHDDVGEIDLLAKPTSLTLYLIELKKEDNTNDTLLRSVLEIYTYSKIVDQKRLLQDFQFGENSQVKLVVAVFKDSAQHKQISLPNVVKLIKKLEVEIVTLTSDLKVELAKLPDIAS